jgi:hypothetical protein
MLDMLHDRPTYINVNPTTYVVISALMWLFMLGATAFHIVSDDDYYYVTEEENAIQEGTAGTSRNPIPQGGTPFRPGYMGCCPCRMKSVDKVHKRKVHDHRAKRVLVDRETGELTGDAVENTDLFTIEKDPERIHHGRFYLIWFFLTHIAWLMASQHQSWLLSFGFACVQVGLLRHLYTINRVHHAIDRYLIYSEEPSPGFKWWVYKAISMSYAWSLYLCIWSFTNMACYYKIFYTHFPTDTTPGAPATLAQAGGYEIGGNIDFGVGVVVLLTFMAFYHFRYFDWSMSLVTTFVIWGIFTNQNWADSERFPPLAISAVVRTALCDVALYTLPFIGGATVLIFVYCSYTTYYDKVLSTAFADEIFAQREDVMIETKRIRRKARKKEARLIRRLAEERDYK